MVLYLVCNHLGNFHGKYLFLATVGLNKEHVVPKLYTKCYVYKNQPFLSGINKILHKN